MTNEGRFSLRQMQGLKCGRSSYSAIVQRTGDPSYCHPDVMVRFYADFVDLTHDKFGSNAVAFVVIGVAVIMRLKKGIFKLLVRLVEFVMDSAENEDIIRQTDKFSNRR